MKIFSLFISVLFLFLTTSVAQIRYAIVHPIEISPVLVNIAMAFCIYMVVFNLTKSRIPKNSGIRIPNVFHLKNTLFESQK